MSYDFGEKLKERNRTGEEVPVAKLPKYTQSKEKAIELIESKKYGLAEADFWILTNEIMKGAKIGYTGLIISHNGCLKINDAMKDCDRFKPECVTVDKDGYNESLVFTYCCPEQGIYEIGEANKTNCKNAYVYAMAYKRLFDRVVLKISKVAFAGIYSETEADEFKKNYDEEDAPKKPNKPVSTVPEPYIKKDALGHEIKGIKGKMTAQEVYNKSVEMYGEPLCLECAKKRKAENDGNQGQA